MANQLPPEHLPTRAEIVQQALRMKGLRKLSALRRIMATEAEITEGRKVLNASPG